MYDNLIDMARELGREIQANEEYIDFRIKQQNLDCNAEIQEYLKNFNSKKNEINQEISKENCDNTKIDLLNKEIAEIYKNINSNPVMIEYNLSKERFNKILQKISLVINKSAEGIDPYMIEVNDDHNDCTGSCYSCEGCK